MATILCQGLQSCLESPLEQRTLRLKLCSSILPHFSQPLELKPFFPDTTKTTTEPKTENDKQQQQTTATSNDNISNNGGGWSFLQSLSNSNSSSSSSSSKKTTYVHPLVKRSSSAMSEKSLELCTENLGNETGSEDNTGCSILSDTWRAESKEEENKEKRESQRKIKKEMNKSLSGHGSRSFPPPLTTMSGKDCLQVRPHREDGRLVIKAVKAPSRLRSCFHAERSDGRLRLRLVEDSFDSDDVMSEKEGRENDTTDEENDSKKGENDIKVEVEGEEMDEWEKRGKMGILENFSSRRCKEGGEVQYHHEQKTSSILMLNWEPLWVQATF